MLAITLIVVSIVGTWAAIVSWQGFRRDELDEPLSDDWKAPR